MMAHTQCSAPWKVSLHGGHSGAYCDHAQGSLRAMLEAAAAFGYRVFGVTEHAPRTEPRFLYPEEEVLGWDIARVQRNFDDYAEEIAALSEAFRGRLIVLRGFEAELVPAGGYADQVRAWRAQGPFEYCVASAHYVHEILIDGCQDDFDRALEHCGGIEGLAARYYEELAVMVQALEPEVVGHLDVYRKRGRAFGRCDTPAIRRAAGQTLEVIREHGCILDLNTAGYRKGMGMPYPAPWLVQTAHDLGIPFCFGDDSHSPADVGEGIARAREYLLENGVPAITVLDRGAEGLVRRVVPLDD